jgi:hypothetical protein
MRSEGVVLSHDGVELADTVGAGERSPGKHRARALTLPGVDAVACLNYSASLYRAS